MVRVIVYRIFALLASQCCMAVESIGIQPMVHVASSAVTCSVVVPAYNAARTVGPTLASALAQTTRAIEVIVVDDGSCDDTVSIVADLAARDPRLRLISQANAGVSAARNAGIAAAQASVIAFLDADDLWPAHHLATHLRRLADNPQLDVSFSSARYIDETGRVIGAAKPRLTDLHPLNFLQANPTTTTSTWVVRACAFQVVGPFDVTLTRCEDQAWLIAAALAGLAVAGTTDSIVDYRMSTTGLASDLDGMRAGFDAMLDRIAAIDPEMIRAHRDAVLASEDLYLARRALQLDLPHHIARQYLLRALATSPLHVLRQPRAMAGILLRLAGATRFAAVRRKTALNPHPVSS